MLKITELLLLTKLCGVVVFKYKPCKLYVEGSGGNHVCHVSVHASDAQSDMCCGAPFET
jgi:hypothetical protein